MNATVPDVSLLATQPHALSHAVPAVVFLIFAVGALLLAGVLLAIVSGVRLSVRRESGNAPDAGLRILNGGSR